MSTTIEQIYEIILAHGPITVRRIVEEHGFTDGSVRPAVKVLMDRHEIVGKHFCAQYTYTVSPKQHWAHRSAWVRQHIDIGYQWLTGNLTIDCPYRST